MATELLIKAHIHSDYIEDLQDLEYDYTELPDGTVAFVQPVDETLVESLSADDLLEWLGLDAEALIALEVLD